MSVVAESGRYNPRVITREKKKEIAVVGDERATPVL